MYYIKLEFLSFGDHLSIAVSKGKRACIKGDLGMQVCTFDSGLTDVCVCTIICICNLFWEEGNLCENGFCSSLCLAAHAVMKLFHEQNPGISENKPWECLYSPFDPTMRCCKLHITKFPVSSACMGSLL